MSDFEIWVYRGAILILLAILWYLAKGVLIQLKEINRNLNNVSDQGIRHDEQLKQSNSRIDSHENRLNDHAKRIREVEHKQDSCKNCNE